MNDRDMQTEMGLRITYKSAGSFWKGALKNDAGTVWVCDHFHKNRDNGTVTFGQCARGCARAELFRRFSAKSAENTTANLRTPLA